MIKSFGFDAEPTLLKSARPNPLDILKDMSQDKSLLTSKFPDSLFIIIESATVISFNST